jgi:hypothetical protein
MNQEFDSRFFPTPRLLSIHELYLRFYLTSLPKRGPTPLLPSVYSLLLDSLLKRTT